MEDYENIDKVTRHQLIKLIKGGNAHASLHDALHDLPKKLRGVVPDGLPYSIWMLVDHIRIAQWDILKFSTNPEHQSPKWPEGYWPKHHEPQDDDEWNDTLEHIEIDRAKFIELLEDDELNLFEPFQNEPDINLLREALLIADHTSYHTGQIIMIRRLLGDWKS
ncbi:ABC transporter [Mucilaginibacter sp. PPCGB 2223]|uniref:DinB family protein n=1 Tax=Mucilaginibacter sp. PPCGB 2223 TaxID=1886027 RepID=UPI000825FA46|nr:DinB family protein [Mucilaginibacter sp. PPCGB 2223]OCX54153.1 ABC transporter [Mucilaginibacter sp. PPCGB 2223]